MTNTRHVNLRNMKIIGYNKKYSVLYRFTYNWLLKILAMNDFKTLCACWRCADTLLLSRRVPVELLFQNIVKKMLEEA